MSKKEPPNGSRLSCGRRARELAAPVSFKRLLGGGLICARTWPAC